jgi:hypothetical protein
VRLLLTVCAPSISTSYTAEVREQSRAFYVTTDDIFSNYWSDPIYIDVLGYDADLFIDDGSCPPFSFVLFRKPDHAFAHFADGTAFVTRCDVNDPVEKIYGIYQTTVDLETGSVLTPDTLISTGYLPSNSTARPEAPHSL